jgi:hypothetical protein
VRKLEQMDAQNLLNILKGIEFSLWEVQLWLQKETPTFFEQMYPST